MFGIKNKTLLLFVLLLAICLQGILPFLHAHRGHSSLSGLHTPDGIASSYQSHQSSNVELVSKSDDESYVVQIGSELSKELEKFSLIHTLVRSAFWSATKPNSTTLLTRFQPEPHSVRLSFYDSEADPPPSLAPPTQHS